MKQDVVTAGVSSFQQAQSQAVTDFLGAFYDTCVADAGGGTVDNTPFSQADIDSAVQSAKDVDSQALATAQAQYQTQLGQVQTALDQMTAKDELDSAAVQKFTTTVNQLQDALNTIKSLLVPPTDGTAA